MTDKKLFGEFGASTKEDWKKQVRADLKGAEFDEKLMWKISESITAEPLYDTSDMQELAYLQNYLPVDPATGGRQWRNRQEITVSDPVEANRKALDALNNGADEIAFDVSDLTFVDLDALFDQILLPYCAVSWIISSEATTLIEAYLGYTEKKGYAPESLSGSVEVAGSNSNVATTLARLARATAKSTGLKAIAVKTTLTAATDEELATLLNRAVQVIDQLTKEGLGIAEIVANMQFVVETGNHYFPEIAKLRALRFLFTEIAHTYGLDDFRAADVAIHSRTTIRRDEKTLQDPYLNMLSNTTQAMSAVIGGCNVLTVLPHNKGIEAVDNQAERIARNVSNILKEESYLDKTADPAAGSYYIEHLTHHLAQSAWAQFQKLSS